MKFKGKQKIEIAREISAHRSKGFPLSVNEIMKMSKPDFLKLLKKFNDFYEAEYMFGDMEP